MHRFKLLCCNPDDTWSLQVYLPKYLEAISELRRLGAGGAKGRRNCANDLKRHRKTAEDTMRALQGAELELAVPWAAPELA